MNPGDLKLFLIPSVAKHIRAFTWLNKINFQIFHQKNTNYNANSIAFHFIFNIFAFDDQVINNFLTFLSTCPTDDFPTLTMHDLKL